MHFAGAGLLWLSRQYATLCAPGERGALWVRRGARMRMRRPHRTWSRLARRRCRPRRLRLAARGMKRQGRETIRSGQGRAGQGTLTRSPCAEWRRCTAKERTRLEWNGEGRKAHQFRIVLQAALPVTILGELTGEKQRQRRVKRRPLRSVAVIWPPFIPRHRRARHRRTQATPQPRIAPSPSCRAPAC